MQKSNEFKMNVKSSSGSKPLASSIKQALMEDKTVVLCAIGASAVNQAVKACAIARGYVASAGYDLTIRPGFADTVIDNDTKTVVRLIVDKK